MAQVDFYVGAVRLQDGALVIAPDTTCPEDTNKIKRVIYSAN